MSGTTKPRRQWGKSVPHHPAAAMPTRTAAAVSRTKTAKSKVVPSATATTPSTSVPPQSHHPIATSATASTSKMAAAAEGGESSAVGDSYEDYLYILEEKNRVKKETEDRSPSKARLAEKEKGFSSYFNGAHTRSGKRVHPPSAGASGRTARVAVGRPRVPGHAGKLQDKASRARTTPGRVRKAWKPRGHGIKQPDGTSLPVSAPGIMSGEYDDDFESDSQSGEEGANASGDENVADLDKTLTALGLSMRKRPEGSPDHSDDSLEEDLQSSGSLTDVVSDNCRDSLDNSNSSFTGVPVVAAEAKADISFSIARKTKQVVSSVSLRSDTSLDVPDTEDAAADVLAAICAENRQFDESMSADSAEEDNKPAVDARNQEENRLQGDEPEAGRPSRQQSARLREVLDIPEPAKRDTTPVFEDNAPVRPAHPKSGRRSVQRSTSLLRECTASSLERTNSAGSRACSRSAVDLPWLSDDQGERQKTAVIQRGMSSLLQSHNISTSEPTILNMVVEADELTRSSSAQGLGKQLQLFTSTPRHSARDLRTPSAGAGLFDDDPPSRSTSRAVSARDRRQQSVERLGAVATENLLDGSMDAGEDSDPGARAGGCTSRDFARTPGSRQHDTDAMATGSRPSSCLDGLARDVGSRVDSARNRSARNVSDVIGWEPDEVAPPGDVQAPAEVDQVPALDLPAADDCHVLDDLEQSLMSLRKFNETHRGRMETELGLENADELMESYLAEIRGEQEAAKTGAEDTVSSSDEEYFTFEIPVLPCGQYLDIVISTTWGDRHYLGLNGIEMFASDGRPVEVRKITADPADINSLSGCSGDPRVVANLLDGVNHTRDDFHMWLAPFTAGKAHSIHIEFTEPVQLAMMRVWNYNKSRIHSYRGARHVQMWLDGETVFMGEISRASGGKQDSINAFGETILFSVDEEVLTAVSEHDIWFKRETGQEEWLESVPPAFSQSSASSVDVAKRPNTASKLSGNQEVDCQRPETSVDHKRGDEAPPDDSPTLSNRSEKAQAAKRGHWTRGRKVFKGKVLQLQFNSTWGDSDFIGLSGLQVLGESEEPIHLTEDQIEAEPRDITVLPECQHDTRILPNLLNGENNTQDDRAMWLAPYEIGVPNLLFVDLGQETCVTGLRVWNYNKTDNDSRRGAKRLDVFLDEELISPQSGFILRIAPGNVHFDFGQTVLFDPPLGEPKSSMEAVTISSCKTDEGRILYPSGFTFQFRLLSTWGDPYYIGLNGIELYNEHNHLLKPKIVTAFPESCNVLPEVEGDCRTPDKLTNGVYDTFDGTQMWLTPVISGVITIVYFVFETPVTVSMARLWNYAKTPSRGVKDFSVIVEDQFVFSGTLQKAHSASSGILPTCAPPVLHQTVLFTDNQDVIRLEKEHSIQGPPPGSFRMVDYDNPSNTPDAFEDAKCQVAGQRPTTGVPAQAAAGARRYRR